ncbi:MAG: alpha-aminoadipate/glutamate carrier protein LysW/ArgW [Candidatus Nezhaarchaeales archaeon]
MIDRVGSINVPVKGVIGSTPMTAPEPKPRCTECDAEIPMPNDVLPGEVLSCPDCGQEYEVGIIEGRVRLKPAEKLREDWGE